MASESPRLSAQVTMPIVPDSASATYLRKVAGSAAELEEKLKRFEAELGEGRTAGPAKPRPGRGGEKSGRRAGGRGD